MNENYTPIRGFRIVGEKKEDRQLSVAYLHPKHEAAAALDKLRKKVLADGSNCAGREEEFSGDNLISERDAALACAGCPAFKECDFYRLVARPGHGVYAGTVKNMEIPDD